MRIVLGQIFVKIINQHNRWKYKPVFIKDRLFNLDSTYKYYHEINIFLPHMKLLGSLVL